ncbi:MAG: hypothetical protein CMI63_15495 [Parvularcula sp.]|uniref:FkbM family methyltransferase n=1 Tax=Hyphococcus sp. TaxID=2038636 RepID=UPI000C36933C|nr:hypothetical protein [Parvularcula sp.]
MKTPTRNFSEFFKHLKSLGFAPDYCIDVGAASGTRIIYESFPEAYHIAFEPLSEFHAELEKSLKPYKHEIHHCALMNKPGEETLLRHPDRYGSSMMHRRRKTYKNLIPVPVETLDAMVGKSRLSGDVLIKTDCQGADLFVLKGGRQTLSKASVVIIEASLFRFWGDHHPDFFEIIRFMHNHGFALYDLLDGIYRPYDNALGQLDLAFVKEDGPFRKNHQWQ